MTTRSASSALAVREAQAAAPARSPTIAAVGARAAPRRRAPRIAGEQQRRRAGVELALHQPVDEVDDGRPGSRARRSRARPRARAGRRRSPTARPRRRARRRRSRRSRPGRGRRCTPGRSMPVDRRHAAGPSRCRARRASNASALPSPSVAAPASRSSAVDARAEPHVDAVVRVPLVRAQLQRRRASLAGEQRATSAHAVVRQLAAPRRRA